MITAPRTKRTLYFKHIPQGSLLEYLRLALVTNHRKTLSEACKNRSLIQCYEVLGYMLMEEVIQLQKIQCKNINIIKWIYLLELLALTILFDVPSPYIRGLKFDTRASFTPQVVFKITEGV